MSLKTLEALMRQIKASPPVTSMGLSGTLPGGSNGVAYNAHLSITGSYLGPVTVTASTGSFPSWMTVAVSGSQINFTGTPTAGSYPFTVHVVDSTSPTPQVATSAQTVTVASGSPTAMKLTGVLPIAYSDDVYAGTLGIAGIYTLPVTLSISSGSAPAWGAFTVVPAGQNHNINLNGTPPAQAVEDTMYVLGTDTFTILATDSSSPPQLAYSTQNLVTKVPGRFVPNADVQQAGLTVFVRDFSVPVAPDTPSVITNTQIDWGDGSPVETMKQPSFTSTNLRYLKHTYASAGSYSLVQTVTDRKGSTGSIVWPLTLTAFVPPAITGATGTATVVGVLGNGKTVNAVANLGHRVNMVPGDIKGGSFKFYSDGLCATVENGYMGITDDLFGEFHVYIGSTLIWAGPLSLWAYTMARPFWANTPTVLASPDLSLFPRYGAGSESASWYTSYVGTYYSDNSRNSIGNLLPAMGTGGEHDYLGPVPQWDACYLVNPSPQNAEVVRGMGDGAACWAFHFIDPVTNDVPDLTDNVKISAYGASRGQAGNPIVQWRSYIPWSLDQTQDHAINFSSLCCALYGSEYDKESLSMWANYVQAIVAPGNLSYRLPSGCVTARTIPRGIGRGLVVMSFAAKLSSRKAQFTYWMGKYAADLISQYGSQTGIQTIHAGWGYPNYGQGPWQMALCIYGIALAIKHGFTADNYPGFQWALDYFMKNVIDSMLPSRGNIQHEFATHYTYAWAYDDGTPVENWEAGIRQMATHDPKLAAGIVEAENSQALQNAVGAPTSKPGDLEGYPTAPDGYPAMQQICLAMGVDHCTDQTGALAAWNAFLSNAVGWGHARIIYTANPKYNIIPETLP
jgi:hypothetical protein